MAYSATSVGTYKRVNVETASQSKLIVLLYNGAIQRAEEAKRQIEKGNYRAAHDNLIRSQEIIAELRSALNMTAGEIAQNLDRIYEYFQHLLVRANIRKDTAPISECVALMARLRDTWQEVFEKVTRETSPTQPPKLNQHGAALMNIQG